MSQSQDKEETKPIISPDETAHTGFGEMFTQATIKQQELTLEKSKAENLPETRTRTLTKKGFEFRCATKEKSAKTANRRFHANVPHSTHSWPPATTPRKLTREQRN